MGLFTPPSESGGRDIYPPFLNFLIVVHLDYNFEQRYFDWALAYVCVQVSLGLNLEPSETM